MFASILAVSVSVMMISCASPTVGRADIHKSASPEFVESLRVREIVITPISKAKTRSPSDIEPPDPTDPRAVRSHERLMQNYEQMKMRGLPVHHIDIEIRVTNESSTHIATFDYCTYTYNRFTDSGRHGTVRYFKLSDEHGNIFPMSGISPISEMPEIETTSNGIKLHPGEFADFKIVFDGRPLADSQTLFISRSASDAVKHIKILID